MTFLEYLKEQEDSPDDMIKKANDMKRLAQLKKSNPVAAKREELNQLRKRLSRETDNEARRELQQQIRELSVS